MLEMGLFLGVFGFATLSYALSQVLFSDSYKALSLIGGDTSNVDFIFYFAVPALVVGICFLAWYLLNSLSIVNKNPLNQRRFFFSASKEEAWLNTKAAEGYLLTLRKFPGIYRFEHSQDKFAYRVEFFEHPADSTLSEALVTERAEHGQRLAAHYKCRAYFVFDSSEKDAFENISLRSRRKHYGNAFWFFIILLLVDLGLFCYNYFYSLYFNIIKYVDTPYSVSASNVLYVKVKALFSTYTAFSERVFGNQATSPILLTLALVAVAILILAAIYGDEYFSAVLKMSKFKKLLAPKKAAQVTSESTESNNSDKTEK